MINRSGPTLGMSAAAITTLVLGAVMSGCGGGEPEQPAAVAQPVRRPVAPPAPPAPKVKTVAQLMADHSIDERILLPEDLAPDSTEERVAVLEFFDAFARGDAGTLGGMMRLIDRVELDALVESGLWAEIAAQISEVEIQTGPSPDGEKCAMAIFTVGDGYQPQLWYYTDEGSGEYIFDAAPTPPGMIDKLYGDDWIRRWHEILEEELALADKPDEDLTIAQVELEGDGGGGGGSARGTSPGGTDPKGPGGPPGRRKPPKKKRRAPGPR